MFARTIVLGFSVASLTAMLSTAATAGSYAKAFVSPNGADAAQCTAVAPCRTVAAALASVQSGGTVTLLSTGGYGDSVSITQSVTIQAAAGISAVFTGVIGVNASGSSVILDNLDVSGVSFQTGTSVSLRNMNIGQSGIIHAAPGGSMNVTDTRLRNGYYCFKAETTSGTAYATILNSHAENCYFGFVAGGNSVVSISGTSAVGSATSSNSCYADFVALGTSSGAAKMELDNVVATQCYIGAGAGPLNTGGNGSLAVGRSFLTGNQIAGGAYGSSTFSTFGDNHVVGNSGGDYLSGTKLTSY